jgi:hypothetical protein
MLGIILTLFAVLLVICFAFYYSDHPSGRGARADTLFYIRPKGQRKDPDRTSSQNMRDAISINGKS